MSPIVAQLGGHNDQLHRKVEKFRCGGTIAKGNVVKYDTSSASDYGRVVVCTEGIPPVGVALEGGADGDYIKVQTWGIGLVNLLSDGSVAANAWIIPDAVAGAVSTDAVDGDTPAGLQLGFAFAADTITAVSAGTYLICPTLSSGSLG